MGRRWNDHVLVQRNMGIVLLVDVEVLDQPFLEEIFEVDSAALEDLNERRYMSQPDFRSDQMATDFDMFVSNTRVHLLHDDHRPTNSTRITGDVDNFMMLIHINADKLVDTTGPA